MGRLVWNHSTHVEGLIAVLKKLVEHPDVGTVIPARLKSMKRANRSRKVRLRVTVKIMGGWKLKAVRGGFASER